MIRVNRSIVAAALLGGAALLSVVPAQAQVPPQPGVIELEPAPREAEKQPIDWKGPGSGSADIMCGTIWQPACSGGIGI